MTDPASTIPQLLEGMRTGRVDPVTLVESCLARIRRFEARVKAWVSIDEQGALEQATLLHEEAKRGAFRGPLHGIPVGVKDLIDCQGWPTLAGSSLRKGHIAKSDSPLVARLRNAGAIILGKTVTTEFACFDPSVTRNPWNLAHTPGGSSSGSAAAVAMGMCQFAIGTQTGGSITRPASFCGVAGLKPSFGRVPRIGIVPLTYHLDHPGPIARHVADLAVALSVLAGPHEDEPTMIPSRFVPTPDSRLDRPPRLGFLRTWFMDEAHPHVRGATTIALDRLVAGGARVSDVETSEDWNSLLRDHRQVMAVEAASCHHGLFREHREKFGRHVKALLEEGLETPAIDYAAAIARQADFRSRFWRNVGDFDALVTPATVTTAPATLASTGEPKFNAIWSHSGLPTVSIPGGLADDGLPISLQFIGGPEMERELFDVAAWCERALDFRETPPILREAVE